MKTIPAYRLMLMACLALSLVNALGAIASNTFNFNYLLIFPASITIYIYLAYVIAKNKGTTASMLYTAALGFFDSTIGWKISILLQANTVDINNHPKPLLWIATVIFVMLYGALIGLICGVMLKFKKNKLLKLQ